MLSIIVPVYNEEKRLPACLTALQNYSQKNPHVLEVILACDGSTDRTPDIFREMVGNDPRFHMVMSAQNKGKGFAVKQGFLQARGDEVLFSDVDLSTPIECVEMLLPHLATHDVVIGSRKLPGTIVDRRQPFIRRTISLGGDIVRKLFFLSSIYDTQCGFKLFRKKSIEKILPHVSINRFAFDIELLVIAQEQGLTVKEVAVPWQHNDQSALNIWKASVEVLSNIFLIKKNQLLGKYKTKSLAK